MEQGLNFGQALEALKAGKRASRAGWNRMGMWIALTPGSIIPASSARSGHAVAHLVKELQGPSYEIRLGARLDMKAADGSMVIGWLASQTDLLAEDWCVLD